MSEKKKHEERRFSMNNEFVAGQLCLNLMHVWPPVIYALFKGQWCWTEYDGIVWSYEEAPEEWRRMVEAIEEERNILVYHVTHSYTWFGECLNLLFIPAESKSAPLISKFLITRMSETSFKIYDAYVINLDNPECSELGSIIVNSAGGGLVRTDYFTDAIERISKGKNRDEFLRECKHYTLRNLILEHVDDLRDWRIASMIAEEKEILPDSQVVKEAYFPIVSMHEPTVITYMDGKRFAYSYPYSLLDINIKEIPADKDRTEAVAQIMKENEESI